ncbi:MAG: SlyX family protein [Proteobacteria bacterium]|nr:SlyX family protein [Pseudomonadota bacterium]
MQDKIIELETKYSFQEDLLQELNQEVYRQRLQLDEVVREFGILKAQLAELLTQDAKLNKIDQSDEKPPHY